MNRILTLLGICLFGLPLAAQDFTASPVQRSEPGARVVLHETVEDWNAQMLITRKVHVPQNADAEALAAVKERVASGAISTPEGVRSGNAPKPLLPNKFLANDFNGSIPNDNDLAISRGGQIASVTNTLFNIYDVSGNQRLSRSLSASRGNQLPGVTSFMYDPRINYDPRADRFVAVWLAGDDSVSSRIVIAFSLTNDPAGAWNFYALKGNLRPGAVNVWSDFPQIALSNDELFITSNLFENVINGGNSYRAVGIWQIQLAQGYAGQPLVYRTFTNPNIFSLTPVQGSPDSYGPNMYFVTKERITGNRITIFEMTNTIAANGTLSAGINYTSPVTFVAPPQANQKGTTRLLNSGDGRISSAYRKDRKIHFVFGSAVDGKPGIFYGRINLSSVGLTFSTLSALQIGSDSLEFGFPSINYAGTTRANFSQSSFIFFNFASPEHYPGNGAFYINPDDEVSEPVLSIEGQNFNFLNGYAGPNEPFRWGDYTDIAVRLPGEAWTAGYYVRSNNRNVTWISQFAENPSTATDRRPEPEQQLLAYPNPAMDLIHFEFGVERPGVYTARIFDGQGREVRNLIHRRLLAGDARISFNTALLPNGVYELVVDGEEGATPLRKRFVVQH